MVLALVSNERNVRVDDVTPGVATNAWPTAEIETPTNNDILVIIVSSLVTNVSRDDLLLHETLPAHLS